MMPIEFREVRRGEADEALAFAIAQGATINVSALRPQLSLVAINAEQTTLGSALHHVDADGRRHIAVHLDPHINPGLARLLIDRALRKAEAAGFATAHVRIEHASAELDTWNGANWLRRLRPAVVAPADPSTAIEPGNGNTPSPSDEIPAGATPETGSQAA
ncbi:MAG: hypothetical protein AAGL98_14740, partial [Planctomycetota bacterium]